ncbi:MAG: short chain dehydrogenase [Methanoregula sp. PtaU1.Bin051]|nr:MAG: short chain dehydrogenase [Methanoregula sp. PtaU1.Bin051]
MRIICSPIISLMLVICFLATAGCTGTFSPACQPQQGPAVKYTAVSFNATPVRYAPVNGVTLGYREFGSGEPVLMVQGFGATMDNWNETFVSILASKYHVYTYDHRGMGYSSDNNATPTIAGYADDAAGLMAALGYESMHVYGVSMGSSISQQLAIDHPGRVRKLILDSSAYSIRLPETTKLFSEIEAAVAGPATPEGIRKEAQANLVWNGSWDGLSGIKKDVMLVVGTSDDLTPDPVSVRMAGQINGSWLVRFKGLPHVGSHYAPVEYGENALCFLGMDESPLTK